MKIKILLTGTLSIVFFMTGHSQGQTQMIDLNNNGLDDIWEEFYNATGVAGNADSDGDRASNLHESIAGTDPFDASSVMKIQEYKRHDDSVELSWSSEMGKVYEIEFGNDLTSWTSTNIVFGGTGGELTYTLSPLRSGETQQLLSLHYPIEELEWDTPNNADEDVLWMPAQSYEFVDDFGIEYTDAKDNYIALTKAYLTPTVTGIHRFKVAGDDRVRLYLSTDADPENREMIARTPAWPTPHNSFSFSEQTSEDIQLIAGERYYIETRLFEGTGQEGMHVVWEGPGIPQQDLPAAVLSPFEILPSGDVSFFRVRVTDADVDEDQLSDWVELKYGFSTQTSTSYNGIDDYTALFNEVAAGPTPVQVAYVRPLDPLNQAAGAGIASLRFISGTEIAEVSLEFNHLTEGNYSTSIKIRPADGSPAVQVYDTPDSEFTEHTWTLGGSETSVVNALADGRLFIQVQTSTGEWRGVFKAVGSSMFFMPPSDPPVLTGGTPTRLEAIRFLAQASFGSDEESIAQVQALGFEGWIDQQFALPPSFHQPVAEALREELTPENFYYYHRPETWWNHALTAPDQLRMRMAFALSQIIPVNESATRHDPVWAHHYYDKYVAHAFGSYRALLKDVTLSPAMGIWLTYLDNRKADPETGSRPDENYAREIMQLFSIGLVKLHPDGTVKLGRDGRAQHTYNQETISNMARVFTGWNWAGSVRYTFLDHMEAHPLYHDDDSKTIVNGVILPADQTAEKDLDDTLDVLTNHENIAPFISRLLIKRFTTSNPSPDYVYRVASVWNDNGSGERGDLSAVIKAILLDYEARTSDLVSLPGAGKISEPIMRWTRVFRALGVNPQPTISQSAAPRRFTFHYALLEDLGQQDMESPTVFNFFRPDFVPPRVKGAPNLFDSGLTAPEFQILTETVAVSSLNRILKMVTDGYSPYDPESEIKMDFELDSAHSLFGFSTPGNTATLVDHLDEILTGGLLTNETRTIIINALNHPDMWTEPEQRLRTAIYLIVASPEHASQP